MSVTELQLSWLHDGRLASLATSALPAWLWSTDATRIMWANPVGAAIFGASTAAAIESRTFDSREPACAQIARLTTTLTPGTPGASPRLERLRGFGASLGRALTCACSQIVLADGTPAILVVAVERAGPSLALAERVQRLLAGSLEPLAAFSAEGELLHATESAQVHLRGATSLAAIGGESLVAEALASGHAAGRLEGPIEASIERIGDKAATVLIARVDTPPAVQESGQESALSPAPLVQPEAVTAAASIAAAPGPPACEPASPHPPEMPSERRHPLRFVWQMDDEGRFALGSDEFIALIGPRTAALLGRPWQDMATELALDPEGQIARATATHDTWSGLTVVWPVDGSEARLAVELSGLPVFDRERIFRGYRGFGVCRDLARLAALARQRQAAATAPAPEPARESAEEPVLAVAPDTVQKSEPADRTWPTTTPTDGNPAAAKAIPDQAIPDQVSPDASPAVAAAAEALPPEALPHEALPHEALPDEALPHEALPDEARPHEAAPADAAAENIVPFRAAIAEPNGPALSAVERSAFRELSRKLRQRLTGVEHADAEVATSLDEGHAAVAPAERFGSVSDARPMLDKLPVGILVYRFDQLLYANPAFLRGSGHQSLEALRAAGGLDDLFIEPIGAAAVGDDRSLMLTIDRGDKISVRSELINIQWEGEPAHALVTAAEAPEPPELKHARAEIADLRSIWKKTEDDLTQAKREAEKASSAQSGFLAKVSHEIRTPLTAIIGFSEVMLEERFGPIGNARYRDYLEGIHASGGHLLTLINDLLDLSRIEAGRLELDFTSVALNDLTQQCVAIMQPQASRERILIRTSLPPALPPVLADARSLRQIVLNLLSNSIKFTSAGGQVIVSTALDDNGEVVLRVRDTGVGMSEKDLITALEPFRQLATSGRAGSGGGLGLPLTKALAEANRASFQIKSTPKEGTLVEIAFPATHVLAD